MNESEINDDVKEHFRKIAENASKFVEPFVIGIYTDRTDPKLKVKHVGTGFLVARPRRARESLRQAR